VFKLLGGAPPKEKIPVYYSKALAASCRGRKCSARRKRPWTRAIRVSNALWFGPKDGMAGMGGEPETGTEAVREVIRLGRTGDIMHGCYMGWNLTTQARCCRSGQY